MKENWLISRSKTKINKKVNHKAEKSRRREKTEMSHKYQNEKKD